MNDEVLLEIGTSTNQLEDWNEMMKDKIAKHINITKLIDKL